MPERQPEPHDKESFWTDDVSLFEAQLPFYRGRPTGVRAKLHYSEETYRAGSYNEEIVPLRHKQGTRTYLMLHHYVLEPDITLTVGLYSSMRGTGAIGEVLSAEQRGVRHRQLGIAQAWHYPADSLLVLWECYLFAQFRPAPLLQDANMRSLWTAVEHCLLDRFPTTERIVTPFDDPEFTTDDYQTFLRSLGYAPVARAAFGKDAVSR